jgi:hypothetical protein
LILLQDGQDLVSEVRRTEQNVSVPVGNLKEKERGINHYVVPDAPRDFFSGCRGLNLHDPRFDLFELRLEQKICPVQQLTPEDEKAHNQSDGDSHRHHQTVAGDETCPESFHPMV